MRKLLQRASARELNNKNADGETPLMAAVRADRRDAAELLLEKKDPMTGAAMLPPKVKGELGL